MNILFPAVAILLAIIIAFRSGITRVAGGKILAFLALFVLPVIAVAVGFSGQMERATSTQFCLSCHVMEDYGKSLYVDDKGYLPAAHFQNNRIPRDHACYTCHTDYTMFGGVKSKWRGLHHVYVQYLGKIPKPADIKLYEPFNNRECLHCHEGSRSFEESSHHQKTPDMRQNIESSALSCTSSNCHDTVHDVGTLTDVKFWKGH